MVSVFNLSIKRKAWLVSIDMFAIDTDTNSYSPTARCGHANDLFNLLHLHNIIRKFLKILFLKLVDATLPLLRVYKLMVNNIFASPVWL